MDSVRLAQLMCSRLCHDLITPVGAISSGLEIIEDSAGSPDPELLELTAHSARNAAQRLTYYRAAFGFSGTTFLTDVRRVHELLKEYLETYRISLQWSCDLKEGEQDENKQAVLKAHARTLLNLAGIMAMCAPYGGVFEIQALVAEDNPVFSLRLTGDLVELKQENRLALKGEVKEEDVTPHCVQAYLTHLFLDQNQAVLDIRSSTNEVLEVVFQGDNAEAKQYGSLF